jgi:hypothetical protein
MNHRLSLRLGILLLVVVIAAVPALASAAKPKTRTCASGTIKGYATFDYDNVANALPQSFSNDKRWFKGRFDCSGAAAEIRGNGGNVEVRFPGVTINAAVASVFSPNNRGSASVMFSGDTVTILTNDPSGNVVSRGFSLIVT